MRALNRRPLFRLKAPLEHLDELRVREVSSTRLANLTAWAVTDQWSIETLCRALGNALGCAAAK